MTVQTRPTAARAARSRTGIVDCDIHPAMKGRGDLDPFLPERWREHYAMFGAFVRQAYSGSQAYPRMAPATARADAWPPNGGPPASDLDFLREQHLDLHHIETGILHPLNIGGYDQRNLEFGAALSAAINMWQLAAWVEPEPRLRASIYVPQDHPAAAVAAIETYAGDSRFVQVSCAPTTQEPLGHRRYWPVLEAVAASGLPLAMHVGGIPGHAPSAGGWPSYYFEHHFSNVPSMMGTVVSLVLEGVLERFPGLRILLVETGFVWMPALCWRLDQHWSRMRAEVPHLKRPPSEYIREHFWYSTQPIDEPENPRHLAEVMDWLGWDRILYASDYPHWDFDDPDYVFRINLSPEQRRMVFGDNARALYRLG